jgi:hypothetical protein
MFDAMAGLVPAIGVSAACVMSRSDKWVRVRQMLTFLLVSKGDPA